MFLVSIRKKEMRASLGGKPCSPGPWKSAQQIGRYLDILVCAQLTIFLTIIIDTLSQCQANLFPLRLCSGRWECCSSNETICNKTHTSEMGKNDSALPKGGERRAGGTPAPAAAGLWERLPGPGSAAQLAAGSGVWQRGLPSGQTAGTRWRGGA